MKYLLDTNIISELISKKPNKKVITFLQNISDNDLPIKQWEIYEIKNDISKNDALSAIHEYLENNNLQFLNTSTQIIIVPGYEFKIVNTLITNYHQPKSTLLLLIAAFVGEDWKRIYNYSLKNN